MKEVFILPLDMTLKEWCILTFINLSYSKIYRRLFYFLVAILIVEDIISFPSFIQSNGLFLYNLLSSVSVILFPVAFVIGGTMLSGLLYPPIRKGTLTRYSPGGVQVTKGNAHIALFWRQFGHIRETRNFLLISFTTEGAQNLRAYHPILKRNFTDEHALEEFRLFLNKQLPI